MRAQRAIVLAVLAAWAPGTCLAASQANAAESASRPATAQVKTYIAVFDFAGGEAGKELADSLRLRLRRHEQFTVIDRLTTQEMSGPVGADADRAEVLRLMTGRLGVNVAFYGTVRPQEEGLAVDARRLALRGDGPQAWSETYSDETPRARAAIARQMVEAFTGEAEWTPPQYGDEPEPEQFGRPLNANGGFENGHAGWDHPDNVGTFLQKGPDGRGRILRIRTDLQRGPWLRYRRALRTGQADPTNPPSVGRDTGYGSVAGIEGVHYRSEYIKAQSGRRYWIVADHCGPGGAKVFVKGFRSSPLALDGLPESSLAERGLTPRQFAALPPARRKALIAADAKAHPMRYLLECYRTHLNCSGSKGEWKHFAKPFPPRGGLPENVEYFQVQVYCNWPPGDYLWDHVHLYKDPRQTKPLPEEPARTPNFDKTSEKVPAPDSQPAE